MSNLFYKLHLLTRGGLDNKHEDCITEIFAEILRDEDTALDFFRLFVGHNIDEISWLRVTTQETYIKLSHHEIDSKPDVVIKYGCNKEINVVFFENKIESLEGPNQLRRYADHLKSYLNNGGNVTLIYITKNYDPKDHIAEELFTENMHFVALRWYQIYQWLEQRRNCFIDKVLNYMEVLNMNQNRRFAPIDIIVMQDMKRIFSMMDECIGGQVEKTFTTLFGKQAQYYTRLTQLRDQNKYVSFINFNNLSSSYVSYGFSMYDDEYPNIYASYELTPNYNEKVSELARMKDFVNKHDDWATYGYDDDRGCPGIKVEKNIVDILRDDDHVTGIQNFLIEKANELSKLLLEKS